MANSPGNSVTVAESTLLLMLALAKQLPMWVAAARLGQEPTRDLHGLELRGKTLGLVGFGRIGQIVAGLARAFGMQVLVWGREPSRQAAQQDGYSVADSKEILNGPAPGRLKMTRFSSGESLPSSKAWRSEPGPESLVLVTNSW